MKSRCLPALLLLGMAAFTSHARAQMPRTLSFQGVLANTAGTLVPDGNYAITLKLYDAPTGGNAVYTEEHASVTVVKGVMNVIIGSVTPIPPNMQFNRAYFLGIAINGGAELVPRTTLTAAPYALHAAVADRLAPGASGVVSSVNGAEGTLQLRGEGNTTINRNGNVITITSGGGGTGIQGVQSPGGSITVANASGPVASLDLADNSVTESKLADNSITESKLADNSITTSKLADGSVTLAKLGDDVVLGGPNGRAGGDLTGNYPNPSIARDAVTGEKIDDGTITGADVSTDARLQIATLSTTGNIGIGVKDAQAGLEIRQQSGLGLLMISGGTALSHRDIPATSSVVIPENATVVRLVDDGEINSPVLTLPSGPLGRLLVITNDNQEIAEVPPSQFIYPGQTRILIQVGGTWRIVE